MGGQPAKLLLMREMYMRFGILILFALLFSTPPLCYAQTITTIVGGGEGGLATDYWLASLGGGGDVLSVAVDADGNVLVGTDRRILKIDSVTGVLSALAGNGNRIGSGGSVFDVPLPEAKLRFVTDLDFDPSGNVVFLPLNMIPAFFVPILLADS